MVELKISPKYKSPLEVLLNKKDNIITIKSGRISKTKKIVAPYLEGPYSKSDEEEIKLIYDIDGGAERQEDISTLMKFGNINVKRSLKELEDPLATFLSLYFPKGTKIDLTNYNT